MKNKIIIASMILLVFNSYGEEMLQGIFKTVYYYENNSKIAEARVKECKTLNEMTFAIEKDCANAKRAKKKRSKQKHIDYSKIGN